MIHRDGRSTRIFGKISTRERGSGLPIRDCARSCTNRGKSRPMMSAIDMTAKTLFECLYLVLGLRIIAPWVKCPCAPTTPTVLSKTISRFLCNFFPKWPLIFGIITIHQAKSLHPRGTVRAEGSGYRGKQRIDSSSDLGAAAIWRAGIWEE